MIGPLLEELRPKQWTKNLLVFAGVVFAQGLGDPRLVWRAVAGFVAFSLLSGSVYLLNDIKDVEADRRHPVKRNGRWPRPAVGDRRVGRAGAHPGDRRRAGGGAGAGFIGVAASTSS